MFFCGFFAVTIKIFVPFFPTCLIIRLKGLKWCVFKEVSKKFSEKVKMRVHLDYLHVCLDSVSVEHNALNTPILNIFKEKQSGWEKL